MLVKKRIALYFTIGLGLIGFIIIMKMNSCGTRNYLSKEHAVIPDSVQHMLSSGQDPHGYIDNLPPAKQLMFNDTHFHHDDDRVAKELEKSVRVLCWIMTSPGNLEKKAQHVKATWAKRCNVVVFVSSETNKDFPTIGVNAPEGREHLTAKTMAAFRYVYDQYFDQADWFMKTDDDTYVIIENLRYMLSAYNSSDPIFFGHKFKVIVKQGYFSGGAGYVISKEALKRFANRDKDLCSADGGSEDVEFGRCMEKLGVKAGNSTDALGRSRFHCFNPEMHLSGGYPDWYYQYDANGGKKGEESMSDYAVSFHYVPPETMYYLEYYIYHLTPYGIKHREQNLNPGRH